MSKHRVSAAAKKRLLVFGTISIICIIYFVVQLSVYSFRIYSLTREEKKQKTTYKELQLEAKDLRTKIEKLQDPDYIARYIRENYSYSKNGEYIIKHKDNEKTDKQDDEISIKMIIEKRISFITNLDYQYILYFILAIIIFIIFKKSKKKK